MKKSLFILSLTVLVFAGCKNNGGLVLECIPPTTAKTVPQKKGKVLSGKFIYTDKAAVLRGYGFTYGVVPDSMAQLLASKVKPAKLNKNDMVPVVIRGFVKPNTAKDRWDTIVKIDQIIYISKSKPDSATGVNSNKKK